MKILLDECMRLPLPANQEMELFRRNGLVKLTSTVCNRCWLLERIPKTNASKGPVKLRFLSIAFALAFAISGSATTVAKLRQDQSPLYAGRVPLVYQSPGMAKVSINKNVVYKEVAGGLRVMDVFSLPGGAKQKPAVIFLTQAGGPHEEKLKDWAGYQDWGRLIAANGMVGVVIETRGIQVQEDISDLLKFVAAHGADLGIDATKIGFFSESANVFSGLPFVNSYQGGNLKCAVYLYGYGQLSSIRKDLPVLSLKAEQDNSTFNQGIDRLWDQARREGAPWTTEVVHGAPHAFETLYESPECIAAIKRVVSFFAQQLKGDPSVEAAMPITHAERRVILSQLRLRKWADALPTLERLWKSNQDIEELNLNLLDAYEWTRKGPEALALSQECAKKWPLNGNFWAAQGRELMLTNQATEAIDAFCKAIALFQGEDSDTEARLGTAYLIAKRPFLAVTHLRSAVRLAPTLGFAWYNLSIALSKIEQHDRAIDAFRTAIATGNFTKQQVESDEDFAELRSDPRFQEMVKRLP